MTNLNIKLQIVGVIPDKKAKHINFNTHNFGVIKERRNPKVITDEHKLFGTRKNHKYY